MTECLQSLHTTINTVIRPGHIAVPRSTGLLFMRCNIPAGCQSQDKWNRGMFCIFGGANIASMWQGI